MLFNRIHSTGAQGGGLVRGLSMIALRLHRFRLLITALLAWALLVFALPAAAAVDQLFLFQSDGQNGSITGSAPNFSTTWLENGYTLKMDLTGIDQTANIPGGNAGYLLTSFPSGMDWTAMNTNAATTISLTIAIQGPYVFDLDSFYLSDPCTHSAPQSYTLTTLRGGSANGHVQDNQTPPNFSQFSNSGGDSKYKGLSSFTISITATDSNQTCLSLGMLSLKNISPVPPASVTSIAPTSGSAGGGTSVVITGSNFSATQGADGVLFGASNATGYTVDNDTQITATAPAGSGTVHVRVNTVGGLSSVSSNDQFTYVPAPVVSSVSPNNGLVAGGTTITLSGSNFTGATAVKFGSTTVTNHSVVNAGSISVVTPAHAAGTVDVTVVTPGGTSATSANDHFTFIDAPAVTTGAASSVTANGATLGGTVTSNGDSTAVTFEYGTTASYGSTVTAASSPLAANASGAAVSAAISSLTCNTTYHFRVVGSNTAGSTNGSDATFTTTACAPTATTGSASSITANGATLDGTVSSNGASTTVTFEYGSTASYGSTTTAATSPLAANASGAAVSAAISSLTCNTTYHFRVKGVNSAGPTNGSDATFTTAACAPTATTGSASSITANGATLGGTVSSNGASTTVTFEYGSTASYGSTTTAATSPLAANASGAAVSAAISSLTCNTTYHFRVKGVNSAGPTNGSDATFTTAACPPSATTGAASSVTATGATLGGTVSSNGDTTAVTFEYGTSNSYGSTITATTSPLSNSASGASVLATISGLNCNTTYHFRVVGSNTAGSTNGADATFTTTACAPSATTGAASSLTATGASLSGLVSSNGASTTIVFQYGLTTGYGSSITAAQSPLLPTASGSNVTALVTGLTCNTTYHFRIVASNSVGTANGSDGTFSTTGCVPTATTGAASSITQVGAALAGTIADNGSSTAVSFEYGLTTAYGSSATASPASVSAGSGATAIAASIGGLTCNTTYHFRISGTNAVGLADGSDASFTTAACPPTATTGTASSITGTSATLGGTVSSNGASTTVTFQYGLTTAYGSTVTAAQSPLVSGASGASVTAPIGGLTCGTTYHFRVVGSNTSGTSNGSDATFASTQCPPTVTSVTPATGSTLGGTTVVIGGTNFTNTSAVNFGGNAATSFTVDTATQITAVSPAGSAGVVNVTVTNPGGTSATAAANQFTYNNKTYTGSIPGGTGSATATITGGGASCHFANAQFVTPASQSLTPPPGYTFNQGLLAYTLSGCNTSTVTVTITYPSTPGSVYWKYGKTLADPTSHWYQLSSANFSANTVSFNITDGGLGDDDLTINGTIVDPGGPATPLPAGGVNAIPTLSEWAMMILAGLMLVGLAYQGGVTRRR